MNLLAIFSWILELEIWCATNWATKLCPESWSFLGNLCFTEMTTQSGLFVAHGRAPVQKVTPSTLPTNTGTNGRHWLLVLTHYYAHSLSSGNHHSLPTFSCEQESGSTSLLHYQGRQGGQLSLSGSHVSMEAEFTPSILQVRTTSSICCKVVEEKCNSQRFWRNRSMNPGVRNLVCYQLSHKVMSRKLVISGKLMFHRNDHTVWTICGSW